MEFSSTLSAQELVAELLPAREALSATNTSDLWAENTAVAVNHGDHGEANADANQKIDVDQDGDDHGKHHGDHGKDHGDHGKDHGDHGKDHHGGHHCKK